MKPIFYAPLPKKERVFCLYENYTVKVSARQVVINVINNYFAAEARKADGNNEFNNAEIDSIAAAHVFQLVNEKFLQKKRDNLHLSLAYLLTDFENRQNKAARLTMCANYLEFALPPEGDDPRFKVVKTSSCHVRLCPVCQWRRSLNVFRNLAEIYEPLNKQYKHIFLTLTYPNCTGKKLPENINRFTEGFAKMMRRKPFKDIVLGYTRTIEVTHNEQTDLFHPHLHAILTVPKSYGKKVYIPFEDWQKEWHDITNWTGTFPLQVNVKMIKAVSGKAIAELAKYAVKPSDYIKKEIEETARLVQILDVALGGRRFVSYGGVVKQEKQKIFKSKNLEDVEAEEIPKAEWEEWERVIYEWHFGKEKYERRKPV